MSFMMTRDTPMLADCCSTRWHRHAVWTHHINTPLLLLFTDTHAEQTHTSLPSTEGVPEAAQGAALLERF
jgi:hypothetical protein